VVSRADRAMGHMKHENGAAALALQRNRTTGSGSDGATGQTQGGNGANNSTGSSPDQSGDGRFCLRPFWIYHPKPRAPDNRRVLAAGAGVRFVARPNQRTFVSGAGVRAVGRPIQWPQRSPGRCISAVDPD